MNPKLLILTIFLATIQAEPTARPSPYDTERKILATPLDDPMHNVTIRRVLGCRRMEAINATHVKLTFGAVFNGGAARNGHAYEIFSPDDPAYPFKKFIKAAGAKLVSKNDIIKGVGPAARLVRIHEVTLTLPSPMQEGKTYFIRGTGGGPGGQNHHQYRKSFDGHPITSGVNAGKLVYGRPDAVANPTDDQIKAVMGLRAVEVASSRHLKLTLGTSTKPSDSPSDYKVDGKAPLKVGRISQKEHLVPGSGWPFRVGAWKHEIYLELADPLAEGKTFEVSLPETMTSGRRKLPYTYSDLKSFNPHIKVNQCGYLPESPAKWGYIGAWTGSGGVIDYSSASSFKVIDAKSGKTAFTGKPTLRKKATAKDEGIYKEGLGGEDLYLLDFSALKTPGNYFVAVPGNGRSFEFAISADAYLEAFHVTMAGLFFQRCGQEIGPPHSQFRRIACHADQVVEYTTIHSHRDGWKHLDKTKKPKIMIGGHHDAGDYMPRAHYIVAESLMRAYEMNPKKFYDGQLHIPENKNGLPDILDEAYWALRLFEELQDEDGGVHNNVETPGDPGFCGTPERDSLRMFTLPKNSVTTFIWSACAAQAARLWKKHGKDAKADEFLKNSVRAYDWGIKKRGKRDNWTYSWAAAELARTTGEQRYTDAFKSAPSNFSGNSGDWNADITYALNDHPNADAAQKQKSKQKITSLSDYWIKMASTHAYPTVRHPEAPIGWGGGAYPVRSLPIAVSYHLTKDDKYLQWLVLGCDLGLGCNPKNLSYTTGLGQRYIHGPLHLWGWHTYLGRVMQGIQSEGPMYPRKLGGWWNNAFPDRKLWPTYYTHFDIRYCPPHNEVVVRNQAMTAEIYAALLPDVE
ncbi:MAG: glycoside hydrolase family 9 protein [Planctomycetota bacterium]|jgi:endoglucanase|nr:glycoside hydrolase family 9 protein [Planctomycetota bacterium]